MKEEEQIRIVGNVSSVEEAEEIEFITKVFVVSHHIRKMAKGSQKNDRQ